MKLKLIACEALHRECCWAVAMSPQVVDVTFMPFGLHNTPDHLRDAIQVEIDASDAMSYSAVLLGYGLCSRATAEVKARSLPLIIPKAHDCITLFLGSRCRYNAEFTGNPGTYYYSPGWIERKEGEVQQGDLQDVWVGHYEDRFKEYSEKYGEDNAQYLIEQESQWLANYKRAALINTGLGEVEGYRTFVTDIATQRGWDYTEIAGDISLIHKLVSGEWDTQDLLYVKPGQTIRESYDDSVLLACSSDGP